METIGDRIILLREALGENGRKMSQTEFGKKIGLSQTGVAAIENNKNGCITNSNILSIVREFHVNETWLRTGEGEMFLPTTREGEIADFISRTVTGPDNVKKRLIFALSQLSEDEWDVLEKIIGKQRTPYFRPSAPHLLPTRYQLLFRKPKENLPIKPK